MRRRNIAPIVTFAALTMLLCAMWLRSLWWKEQFVWVLAPGCTMDVESDRGNLSARFRDMRGPAALPSDDSRTFIFRSRWLSSSDRTHGFHGHVSRDFVIIASPYWFLVLNIRRAWGTHRLSASKLAI